MNNYNPWGQKSGGNNMGEFGNFGAPGGQKPAGQSNNTGFGNFGTSGSPKPFGSRPAASGSFNFPGGPKPIASRPTGLNNFNLPAAPKPIVNPAAMPGSFGLASRQPGAFGVQPPKRRNFWGDIDGDGKETAWDDVLGDGLLGDALAAQDRARRGAPPEPEDEFLIGRRAVNPTAPAAGSSPAGGVLVSVLLLGVLACAFFGLILSLAH